MAVDEQADSIPSAALPESPLARLRRIRDMLGRVDLLKAERDRLIREAAGDHSQRQIALAAGLSSGSVWQIIHQGAAKPSKRQAPEKEQTSPVGVTLPPPTLPPPPPPITGGMRAPTCVCGAGTSDGEGHCFQCSKPLAGVTV